MRHSRILLVIVLVEIVLPRVGADAATLHVPVDHATIQGCIDAAVSGQDECVVAPGTYFEVINFNGKAIILRSSGGPDVTTIDGNGAPHVVQCVSGEGPDTLLSGFTIEGGNATGLLEDAFGGGMFNSGSSPTVINCTFRGNRADIGGVMYNAAASPAVIDCFFHLNYAIICGGMYNSFSNPSVSACVFIGNSGVESGGAIYNSSSNPMITDCTFNGNEAGNEGGAMYNRDFSAPVVRDCEFVGNRAVNHGGGMHNFDGSNPVVKHCTFLRNQARYGGGMSNTYPSHAILCNCIFQGNKAVQGGGLYNAFSNPTVTNCTFSGNVASYGGGVYNDSAAPSLTNCTFSGNVADVVNGRVASPAVALPISNCIFWGNRPKWIGNAISIVTQCVIEGGLPAGMIDGGGNIDADPMFVRNPDPGPDREWDGVDDDYGDLRLQADSPCINAGSAAMLPADEADLDGDGDVAEALPLDLDGHARVLCGQVDMGAYEFGIGDYDCDRVVDLNDFAHWTPCVTGFDSDPYPAGCESFDFDADGMITLRDFAQFQATIGN